MKKLFTKYEKYLIRKHKLFFDEKSLYKKRNKVKFFFKKSLINNHLFKFHSLFIVYIKKYSRFLIRFNLMKC